MAKPGTRHELKYVVDLHKGEDFMRAAEPFCRPDEHAGADGFYETLSIYYDTESLRFYWDRQESVGCRRKVRLRRYAGGSVVDSPLFLEIKEKHKHMIAKKRCVLEPQDGADILISDSGFLALDKLLPLVAPSKGRDEISFLHERLLLQPVVNVRYLRKALAGQADPTLRITLDKRLTASLPSVCDYDSTTEDFFLPPSQAVLEIKSERSVPLWLLSLVRRFEVSRGRYSKYCAAVDMLKSARRTSGRLLAKTEPESWDSGQAHSVPERAA
jgi:hypothetical protein